MGIPGSPNALLMRRAAAAADDTYSISNSLRFEHGDSSYLQHAPNGVGNTRVWTFAAWVKRNLLTSATGNNQKIFSASSDGSNMSQLEFSTADTINFHTITGGSTVSAVATSAVFRDPSAWMHICVVHDSNEGVQADRFKLYVNGKLTTTTQSNAIEQYQASHVNSKKFTIGGSPLGDGGQYGSFQLAEVFLIDNLALNPAAFGKFDSTGVWNPIDPYDDDNKFKVPAPNTNKTWSGMVSGTALSGQEFTKGFDGSTTTGMEADSDTYATFTPTDPIVANNQIRISIYMRGSIPSTNYDLIVNGTSEFTQAHAVTGTNSQAWYTLNTRTLTSLRFGEDDNSNRWMRIYAIEVDGVILVDGQTDPTTISNPNDGVAWSDWLTDNNSAGFQSNQGATNAFNGNFTNDNSGRCSAGWGGGSSDNGLKFSPPSGKITVNHKLELFTRNQRITVNGGSTLTTTSTVLDWKDLTSVCPTRPFNLTEILTKEHNHPESNAAEIFGVRVDGQILLDKAYDNSLHLKLAAADLGKNEFGDGPNPTVLESDSSTTSTDPNASYLMAALACNSTANLTDDKSTNANDFSKTDVDASTTASKFYGTSAKFTSGDAKLLSPTDTDYAAGEGKFTWEVWFMLKKSNFTHGNNAYIVDMRDGGASGHQGYCNLEYLNSGAGPTNSIVFGGSVNSSFDDRFAISEDTWYHVACVREGTGAGEFKFYFNGELTFSGQENKNSDLDHFVIGNVNSYESYSYGFPGYIQDFRYYKGIAKYTTDFTPPAQPGDVKVVNLTATDGVVKVADAALKPIFETTGDQGGTKKSPEAFNTDSNSSNLQLAIPGFGPGTDESADVRGSGSNKSPTVNSTTEHTGTSRFYGTCMDFDGSNDFITFASNADFTFGTGEWTVEYWINIDDITQNGLIVGTINDWNDSGEYSDLWGANIQQHSGQSKTRFLFAGDGSTPLNVVLSSSNDQGQWVHWAWQRSGNTLQAFRNGVLVDSASTSHDNGDNQVLRIGQTDNLGYVNAKLQDLRIYKGVAKYSSAGFTVPSTGSPKDLDVLVDSPSNSAPSSGSDGDGGATNGNYCTWNPLAVQTSGHGGFRRSNLEIIADTAGSHKGTLATMAIPSTGKWYFEVEAYRSGAANNGGGAVGVAEASAIEAAAGSGTRLGEANSSSWVVSLTSFDAKHANTVDYADYLNGGTVVNETAVIGVAVDMDNDKMWMSYDGTWGNAGGTGNPATGANPAFSGEFSGKTIFPAAGISVDSGSGYLRANFGQRAFNNAAPSGFKTLCTQNLPDLFGANSNANEDKNNPSKYFGVLTYTGDGNSGGTDRKGLNFTPDMVWVKSRSDSYDHHLHDQILSAGANGGALYPNLNDDADYGQSAGLTAFINGGFTAKHSVNLNGSNKTYVAWCWDAGTAAGTPISTGDITPNHVWKNRDAGFSITEYSGSGSDNSVPHDLGAKPDLLFVKKTNAAGEWRGWHSYLGSGKGIDLNNSSGQFNDDSFTQVPDTNYIYVDGSVGNVNTSGNTYMLYAWTAIEGYSAFGGYDGSNDESFIFTGFQPKWIMVKLYSEDLNHGGWKIIDTNRDPINDGDVRNKLSADTSEQENGNTLIANNEGDVDIISNGFRITDNHAPWNTSGRSYLYAAFAEFPFKTARAR